MASTFSAQILVERLNSAGWKRFKEQTGDSISEEDIEKTFKKMDLDHSGEISKRVKINFNLFVTIFLVQELKMAVKYLGKQFGLSDVSLKCW